MTQRFFFVRPMRTGSTSFTMGMRRHFGAEAVYPAQGDGDAVERALSVTHLLECWRQRGDAILAVAGHFPLAATELLPTAFTTLTILRDPIERTLSHLRSLRATVPELGDASLLQIYEDPWRFRVAIHNHYVKLFGLTADEILPDGLRTAVDFSRAHLERAQEGLASVDALGLFEDAATFRSQVSERFGWDLGPPIHARQTSAGDGDDVATRALRERIAHDNALDVELYAFAQDLVRARSAADEAHR